MATVTANGMSTNGKTACCKVCWGDDWMEITNKESGNTLRLDVSKAPRAWEFFNREEVQLFDDLQFHPSGSEVTLSAKQMHCFKKAVERVEKEQDSSGCAGGTSKART